MTVKTRTLYFKDGRSDKVYTASYDENGVVQFAWGRRGGPMQTKTEGPYSLEQAELIWTKKLAEKASKGYMEGQPATPIETPAFGSSGQFGHPVQMSHQKPVIVPKPMLLNEIDDEQLLIFSADPDWWMQEKKDGWRIILVKRGDIITSYSRSGRETNALPKPIIDAAKACPVDFVLDGEIIGDTVWAFDLLEAETTDLRQCPYATRLDALGSRFSNSRPGIQIVETATRPEAKIAMFSRIRSALGEGVVLKLASARYEPGRPNSGGPALKYKFVATASVIVGKLNSQRSVTMQLADGAQLGSVTIPTNREIPAPGSIIEVRYLYAHRGGSLSQAVYLGPREDIDKADCNATQLKYKSEAAA